MRLLKKLLIYSSIIILLFAVLYVLNKQTDKAANQSLAAPAQELYGTTPDNLYPATRDQLNDENYQKIILPDELERQLQDGEDKLVYFFHPTCGYCQETTPILEELAEETETDYVQFNVWEFEDEREKYNIQTWPVLVYYEDGKEVERITGGITDDEQRDQYRSFLEKHK